MLGVLIGSRSRALGPKESKRLTKAKLVAIGRSKKQRATGGSAGA